jgi:hypothetical protein
MNIVAGLVSTFLIATGATPPSMEFEAIPSNPDTVYITYIRAEALKMGLEVPQTDTELIRGAKNTCSSITKSGVQKVWDTLLNEALLAKNIEKSATFKGFNLGLSVYIYCPENTKILEDFMEKQVPQKSN